MSTYSAENQNQLPKKTLPIPLPITPTEEATHNSASPPYSPKLQAAFEEWKNVKSNDPDPNSVAEWQQIHEKHYVTQDAT